MSGCLTATDDPVFAPEFPVPLTLSAARTAKGAISGADTCARVDLRVHDVGRPPAERDVDDRCQRGDRDVVEALRRSSTGVRCDDDVLQAEQGTLALDRLAFGHVEAGAGDAAFD